MSVRIRSGRLLLDAATHAFRALTHIRPALSVHVGQKGARGGKHAGTAVSRTQRLIALGALGVSGSVAIVLLGLLTAFVPGVELAPRDNASFSPAVSAKGAPPRISGWTYRSEISREERGAVSPAARATRGDLIAFTGDGVALLTFAGLRPLRPDTEEGQPLAVTGEAAPAGTALPAHYGEALDAYGRPLRGRPAPALAEATPKACPLPPWENILPRLVQTAQRPIYGGDLFNRAQRYKSLVERFAGRYRINTDLVYAIIHNESNFQPGTISNRRATGLMQLLPSTAGGEVHKFLHGHTSDIDDDELLNPENNLRYGIAYLHLLLNRYFGEVTDPQSREYCAIAAYNLGPNALLNSFSRDRDEAVAIINSLTPEELYNRLSEDLPARETRNFIARVLNSKKEFAEFQ